MASANSDVMGAGIKSAVIVKSCRVEMLETCASDAACVPIT